MPTPMTSVVCIALFARKFLHTCSLHLECGGSSDVVVVGKLKVFYLVFVVVYFVEALPIGGLHCWRSGI